MTYPSGMLSRRSVVVWSLLYFGIYAVFASGCIYLFQATLADTIGLHGNTFQELLHGARVMTTVYLVFGVFVLVVCRIMYHHPFYNPGYLSWLRTTPWHSGMPLPAGSPFPGAIDAVLLLLICAIAFWTFDALLVAFVVSSYGLLYAILAMPTLLSLPKRVPRVYPFALLLLGGLLVLFSASPWTIPAVSAGFFVTGLLAIRTSLRHLPTYAEKKERGSEFSLNPIVMSGVEPEEHKEPVTLLWALGACTLIAFWSGLIHHFNDPGYTELVLPGVFLLTCAMLRVGLYRDNRRPPITLIQRFKTGRLIVPSFDRVLVAPVLAVLACTALLGLGVWLSVYPPVVTGAALFAGMLILFKGGPKRDQWQLTSDHRVVVSS